MADLSKIKVGDILRRDFRVVRIDESDTSLPVLIVAVDGGSEDWATMDEVEAAEHIPAPQVFKRGDWVRWSDSEGEYRHCLVLGKSTHPSLRLLRVDIPCEGVCEIRSDVLEPDEAPE